MSFVRFDSGSAAEGELAEGCRRCIEGSKMVLLVTGRCRAGCYYCPVSAEKKGKDLVYANEWRVYSDGEIIEEAEAMDARGAGITGGDPSEVLDRTLHYIGLLRDRFGPDFHMHMYTSVISYGNAVRLREAGLDEIRYHPAPQTWAGFDASEIGRISVIPGLTVGIEVPALPGREDDIAHMLEAAFAAGASFANLNELEFSESNWEMMERYGYSVKNDTSAAVLGSEETALEVLRRLPGRNVHFCSSTFKDGVQLRNRLKRRAEHIAREYDVITDDGTFIKGILYAPDLDEAARFLREEYDVPDELFYIDRERNRMEIAAWILEEVGGELPFDCCITEEYPTKDRLEVERTPIPKNS